MQTLQTDLNYISSLPDDPAMQTAQLKAEFDKAGNVIKNFINQLHIPEVETAISSAITTANSYTDTQVGTVSGNLSQLAQTVSGLQTSLQDQFDTLSQQLQQQISSSIPDMVTHYATGINFSSGVTQIFNQVFKINNLVHVYLEDNFTISRVNTGATLCVLPAGFKPANPVKCLVLCINEAFTFHVTATINANGAVIIPRSRW